MKMKKKKKRKKNKRIKDNEVTILKKDVILNAKVDDKKEDRIKEEKKISQLLLKIKIIMIIVIKMLKKMMKIIITILKMRKKRKK